MSINLDDYRDELVTMAPVLEDTLEATFHEAARTMSAHGLKDYLDGARGMVNLAKGPELLVTYMAEMPLVAKECGEDVIRDCVGAILKMSSMTSGAVLERMVATLPAVARRLGDPELLRGYLQLLHRLSARAPRGLRPMFKVIDDLLSRLTLTGLRRWVDFGADVYRRDFVRQAAYFGLETEDSKAVMKQERRGTLFIANQRKLNYYLRAFWARSFFLRPTTADSLGFRPFIEDGAMHLPDAVDDIGEIAGLDLYRAMCAHMAAHISYTRTPQPAEALAPAQRFFIGFIDDARVEYCAIRNFPGLRSLWKALMTLPSSEKYEHETMPLLEKTALALLDPAETTGDAEIDDLVSRFHEYIDDEPEDGKMTWDLGIELFTILSHRRAMPSLRVLESIRIPYRDDNRFVWALDNFDWDNADSFISSMNQQTRRNVGLMEMVNEVEVETAGDDAQEIWTLSTELFPYEDEGVSYNDMEGKEPVSDPYHYHEWDYKVQLHRPSWATLYERRQGRGDPAEIDGLLTQHKGVSHRIKQIIDRLRPQGIARQRRLEDGDELDINAVVEAAVMSRIGMQPDTRITMRNVLNRRDLSVVILLDLSESTNETMRDSEKTVLELTREAAALVAAAINGIGDPFSIHGFASDGRHDVQYYRFKDFEQNLDNDVKSRLAGMRGGLSTRMGTAMRHAGNHLLQRSEKHKLLIVVTDGEPADIDERDPQYLRADAKKAVQELQQYGVLSYCLTLDPEADRYVERIFGANNYTIVDQVERLPEKLPQLFLSLTK